MSSEAEMKVDSKGHAYVEVTLDSRNGFPVSGEITPLEGEHLIKKIRAAVTRAQNHNSHSRGRMTP